MRSMRLLAVAAVVLVLVLASAQNVFARTELKYDDGIAEEGIGYNESEYLAVRFSLPPGWSSARLLTVKYFIFRLVFPAPFWVGIFGGSSGEDPLCCIPLLQVDPTGYVGNWLAVDLTGYNVVVSGDFYVAIQYSEDGMPDIGADLTSPEAPPRSYSGTPGSWTPFQDENARDLMIRAEVDAAPAAPVGGSVEPASKLVIFAPYLALFGIVAAVAVVVTKFWKKPDN